LIRTGKPISSAIVHGAVRSGHAGNAQFARGALGDDLVAHHPDMLGFRADEHQPVLLHHRREIGVLGQEAVAGMDGVRAGDRGGAEDRRDIEIAVAGRRRTDAHALVGEPHMHRVGVSGGVDGYRRYAQLAAGAVDAQRDLSAVGDQHLLEHRPSRALVFSR
jgi:hypothetical protein